jgi:hypothetical protein
MDLTTEQVEALAPDAASAKAGKKLAAPGNWQNTAQSPRAIWGECKGSGKRPYQTRVDFSDMASKCSCPSRKFPCKHVLGLLLLTANSPSNAPTADEPDWVTEWLDKRASNTEKKAERQEKKKKAAADPKAQEKRLAKRNKNILGGLDQLDAWMEDLMRSGLARVETEGPGVWEAQARRLIDAQASGIAGLIQDIGGEVGAGTGWPRRVLDGLGQVALLSKAYRNIKSLSPEFAADVRTHVGIALSQEEVLVQGEKVSDRWMVVGQALEDDGGRIRTQRTWLWGAKTRRVALILQFAAFGAGFTEALVPGTSFDAELAYWPSAFPQRALIAKRNGANQNLMEFEGTSIDDALDIAAMAWGKDPWIRRLVFCLSSVRPLTYSGGLGVRDEQGRVLPLSKNCDYRLLFALAGGHAVDVTGEWSGTDLEILTLFTDGEAVPVTRGRDEAA